MTEKAIVSQVDYGFVIVEGLLSGDTYGIAIPQICEFFSIPQKNSSRDIKALLGKDFQFLKWESELHSKAVNVINLQDFAKLSLLLAVKGNELALKFNLAAIEETHLRRFDLAFDKKRTEEEYNARMKARVEGKVTRRLLTDAVKSYIDRHNITGNKAKFYYKHVTDELNKNLTGYSSTKKLREKENIPLKASIRDYASERDLKYYDQAEDTAVRYMDELDMEPCQAVQKAVGNLLLLKKGFCRVQKI